ncbi:MAG: DNA polymerase IV [Planctomycetota bacterium]
MMLLERTAVPDVFSSLMGERHILHVDMDAFYAAVEQRDRPELRGRPILVGGSPQGRGVVATASYEARPFGCHSAMPMAAALRLCPQAIVVTPRFERYAAVSRQVFEILESFTPLVEPLSIDEAFLDVTGSIGLFGPPPEIARKLKRRIVDETGLTASVGVAPNKFVAKLASDLQKPDGLVVVSQSGVQAFLDPLPITRLWGVGKATLPRFEALGVRTFGDARRLPEARLRECFGDAGGHFAALVRGVDDRAVVPDRESKGISQEVTFAVDVGDLEQLRAVLLDQLEHVARRLRAERRLARTVKLKLRTPAFVTLSRQATLDGPTDRTDVLWAAAAGLFEVWSRVEPSALRLIGVGVGHLSDDVGRQFSLFEQSDARRRQLDRTLDAIRERFGDRAITRGRVGDRGDRAESPPQS